MKNLKNLQHYFNKDVQLSVALVCQIIILNQIQVFSPLLRKNCKNADIDSLFPTFYNEFDIFFMGIIIVDMYVIKSLLLKIMLRLSKDRTKVLGRKHFKVGHGIRDVNQSQIPTMFCFDSPNVPKIKFRYLQNYNQKKKNRIRASLPRDPITITSTKKETVPIQEDENIYMISHLRRKHLLIQLNYLENEIYHIKYLMTLKFQV